jgi:hypothetical protein
MTVYFEYRNKRGHVTGYSDNVTIESLEEAARRADVVMRRISEIYTVIAHDAASGEELNRWGM